jgi:hypothetical protein
MTEPEGGMKRATWTLRHLSLKTPHKVMAKQLSMTPQQLSEHIDTIVAWALQHGLLDPESAPDGVGSKRRSTPVLGRMKSYRGESLR